MVIEGLRWSFKHQLYIKILEAQQDPYMPYALAYLAAISALYRYIYQQPGQTKRDLWTSIIYVILSYVQMP